MWPQTPTTSITSLPQRTFQAAEYLDNILHLCGERHSVLFARKRQMLTSVTFIANQRILWMSVFWNNLCATQQQSSTCHIGIYISSTMPTKSEEFTGTNIYQKEKKKTYYKMTVNLILVLLKHLLFWSCLWRLSRSLFFTWLPSSSFSFSFLFHF